MKATVVIFVRTSDVNLPTEQPLYADEANQTDKSNTHNESMPPFWTWFIENPRPEVFKIFPTEPSLPKDINLLVYA